MKKLAILQSNYIPWKGYFDLIASVDEFIIYDEMQYTKNDWRNRNRIITKKGVEWLTIPVRVESLNQKINKTLIFDKKWAKKHISTLQTNYAKAKCFKEVEDFIFNLYIEAEKSNNLSEINLVFIKGICDFLSIETKISRCTDYRLVEGKTERLISLCHQTQANEYFSGPSAREYIEEKLFAENKIKVSWMEYSGYKVYGQLRQPFEHRVSILDLIFNEGKEARFFLKNNI
jgi:hypothetical protein